MYPGEVQASLATDWQPAPDKEARARRRCSHRPRCRVASPSRWFISFTKKKKYITRKIVNPRVGCQKCCVAIQVLIRWVGLGVNFYQRWGHRRVWFEGRSGDKVATLWNWHLVWGQLSSVPCFRKPPKIIVAGLTSSSGSLRPKKLSSFLGETRSARTKSDQADLFSTSHFSSMHFLFSQWSHSNFWQSRGCWTVEAC